MSINLRLARKGADEPRQGLVQQGNYHTKLATTYAQELTRAGWRADKTSTLSVDVAALEHQSAVRHDRRSGARGTTLTESAARNQAKSFIRKLRNALPIVLRDHPDTGVTKAQFERGRLGNSTPKISGYLNDISEPVRKLEGALIDYFDGGSASAALIKVKKDLDEADTVQETTLAGLPQETLKIYEIKGRVLEAIEDINRLAKNAFDGQAAMIAQFNKDLLLRARQERPTITDEQEESSKD